MTYNIDKFIKAVDEGACPDREVLVDISNTFKAILKDIEPVYPSCDEASGDSSSSSYKKKKKRNAEVIGSSFARRFGFIRPPGRKRTLSSSEKGFGIAAFYRDQLDVSRSKTEAKISTAQKFGVTVSTVERNYEKHKTFVETVKKQKDVYDKLGDSIRSSLAVFQKRKKWQEDES